MPIQVQWYDDTKNIIHYSFINVWSVAELRLSIHKAQIMVDSVQHPVSFIADFRQNKTNIANALHITPFIEKSIQPNYALTVVVGVSGYVQTVLKLARKIAPLLLDTFHFVDTIEEAVVIVENYEDTSVPQQG